MHQLEKLPNDARLCECCLKSRPLADFRRRRRGSEHRVRQCRQCHAGAERLRRRAKRSRQHQQVVNRELAGLKNAKSARQVAFVCDSMLRAFGGPDGFAAAWTTCLRRDLGRGGFAALRHLEATIRLIQHCEADRPDYRSMADEEVLPAMEKHIR